MTEEKKKYTPTKLGIGCPECNVDDWEKSIANYYRCKRCLNETSYFDLMERKAAFDREAEEGPGGGAGVVPGSGIE